MRRHSDGVTFSSSDSKTLVEELEKSLITTLMEYMTHWKQYADHTIAAIFVSFDVKLDIGIYQIFFLASRLNYMNLLMV